MKLVAIFLFLLFQTEAKEIKLVGYDNYPIENWRLIIFSDEGNDVIKKSNKEGKLTISEELYEEYKDSHVKVFYQDFGMIKKLYKIPYDLSPQNDQLTLREFCTKSKYKLERK